MGGRKAREIGKGGSAQHSGGFPGGATPANMPLATGSSMPQINWPKLIGIGVPKAFCCVGASSETTCITMPPMYIEVEAPLPPPPRAEKPLSEDCFARLETLKQCLVEDLITQDEYDAWEMKIRTGLLPCNSSFSPSVVCFSPFFCFCAWPDLKLPEQLSNTPDDGL